MLKNLISILIIILFFTPHQGKTYPNVSGTCFVDKDFISISGMTSRPRNYNNGLFTVVTSSGYYIPNQPIEITIDSTYTEKEFAGILFTVVTQSDLNVGTFDSTPGVIQQCSGAVTVTHSGSFGNPTSYTLFWVPPENNVGRVFVEGYILKGKRGQTGSQEFFRFVKEDANPVSLLPRDVFTSGYE